MDDVKTNLDDSGVENLSIWRERRGKVNEYELEKDEMDDVGKLVKDEKDPLNIMYLTRPDVLDASKVYGRSTFTECLFLFLGVKLYIMF